MGLGSFFKRDKKEEVDESHITINLDDCDICEKCAIACPNNVLQIIDGKTGVGNHHACKYCRVCVAICPNDCIEVN